MVLVPPGHGSADDVEVLARRIHGASLIAVAALLVFGTIDLVRGTPWWVPLVKGVQLLIVLLALVRVQRRRDRASMMRTAFVFVGGLVAVAAAASIGRGDAGTIPVLLVMITLCSAALVPWGPRYQAALAAVACAALLAVYAALGHVAAGFPFPGLAVLLVCAVSVFSASELTRQRRARQIAEEGLAESEQRFRSLAEGAPVLIWMTDPAGQAVYLNAAWSHFFGRSVGVPEAAEIWERVHVDDRERVGAAVADALERRAAWECEYRLRDASGMYRWVLTRGVGRYGGDGRFAGHIGTATDITARKEEAEALAVARNAAVEATRLKSDFLATMSHEIRTPMHGIFGMTELALDTEDAEERREFLGRARACAQTLMGLLDEILDFSKIEAGRLELRPVDFDPREVAYEVVETISLSASRRGLELLVSIDDDVPPRVHADAGRFRQILLNLVANAVKFTARGEVELRIRALPQAGGGDDVLRCVVRDTGIGIAPDLSLIHI